MIVKLGGDGTHARESGPRYEGKVVVFAVVANVEGESIQGPVIRKGFLYAIALRCSKHVVLG